VLHETEFRVEGLMCGFLALAVRDPLLGLARNMSECGQLDVIGLEGRDAMRG
jgi:hypothetical protein